MAITIDDFSKIWASTSPLTPYAFSDDNYKQGWNFVGATPPSRQMWDFIQKQNDEKLKYLLDNFDDYAKKTDLEDYLPLAGGTMTGEIKKAGLFACAGVDNSAIRIVGGSGGDDTGSQLKLFGKDDSSNAGKFQIFADDGINSVGLVGSPNENLTWGGKTVIVGTEATETFSSVSVGANVSVNAGTLAHVPKYYSIFATGSGFADCSYSMDSSGHVWCRNNSSVARTLAITVNYIY